MQARRQLSWPPGLKPTAIRQKWFNKISRLPGGLDLDQAARHLREPYGAVRRWAVLFGYEFPDRRRAIPAEAWSKVDWNQRDADISRELGVTRECVRLVRKARGIGPSASHRAVQDLESFVSLNRERLHGSPVEHVIEQSGTELPYHVVRRVLREYQVQPHRAHSTLRQIDWRLSNRDLAQIWRSSQRYIANLRARLGVGPARWSARSADSDRDSEYRAAFREELHKSQQMHRRQSHNHSVKHKSRRHSLA